MLRITREIPPALHGSKAYCNINDPSVFFASRCELSCVFADAASGTEADNLGIPKAGGRELIGAGIAGARSTPKPAEGSRKCLPLGVNPCPELYATSDP